MAEKKLWIEKTSDVDDDELLIWIPNFLAEKSYTIICDICSLIRFVKEINGLMDVIIKNESIPQDNKHQFLHTYVNKNRISTDKILDVIENNIDIVCSQQRLLLWMRDIFQTAVEKYYPRLVDIIEKNCHIDSFAEQIYYLSNRCRIVNCIKDDHAKCNFEFKINLNNKQMLSNYNKITKFIKSDGTVLDTIHFLDNCDESDLRVLSQMRDNIWFNQLISRVHENMVYFLTKVLLYPGEKASQLLYLSFTSNNFYETCSYHVFKSILQLYMDCPHIDVLIRDRILDLFRWRYNGVKYNDKGLVNYIYEKVEIWSRFIYFGKSKMDVIDTFNSAVFYMNMGDDDEDRAGIIASWIPTWTSQLEQ